jgi:DNA-binding transcriptional ArsR family regulator
VLGSAAIAAVASPRRREILRLIWNEERAAGDIHRAMPDVTFGAVSQHLRALVDAGVIQSRTEHKYRYYRARPETLGELRHVLERMWDDALWRLKLQAELEQSRRGPRAKHTRRRRGGKS